MPFAFSPQPHSHSSHKKHIFIYFSFFSTSSLSLKCLVYASLLLYIYIVCCLFFPHEITGIYVSAIEAKKHLHADNGGKRDRPRSVHLRSSRHISWAFINFTRFSPFHTVCTSSYFPTSIPACARHQNFFDISLLFFWILNYHTTIHRAIVALASLLFSSSYTCFKAGRYSSVCATLITFTIALATRRLALTWHNFLTLHDSFSAFFSFSPSLSSDISRRYFVTLSAIA